MFTFGQAVERVECWQMYSLWSCTGTPLDLIASETLRWKCQEPVLLLGKQRFANVDIRIRAKGGGHVSQIYGVFRMSKVAFTQH